MKRLTGELSEMFKRSHELEEEIRKRLGKLDLKSNNKKAALDSYDN